MFLTTRGLVLREVRYKESDKILTVLTQHEGKVTVRARGALRKGSRITAATQLLTYSDMTIFENRGRRTLNEASTVEEFLGLRADLGAFALGSYFAELLETVSAEEYPDPPVLQLGLNSLYALSRALCPPEQIKAVFELRLMCLAGYEPDLSCCARCGAPEPAEPWLSLRGRRAGPGGMPVKKLSCAELLQVKGDGYLRGPRQYSMERKRPSASACRAARQLAALTSPAESASPPSSTRRKSSASISSPPKCMPAGKLNLWVTVWGDK